MTNYGLHKMCIYERVYKERERCITYIKSEIKHNAYPFCNAARTIERSNYIYDCVMSKAMKKIYKTVPNDIYVEVVRGVNEYFKY